MTGTKLRQDKDRAAAGGRLLEVDIRRFGAFQQADENNSMRSLAKPYKPLNCLNKTIQEG